MDARRRRSVHRGRLPHARRRPIGPGDALCRHDDRRLHLVGRRHDLDATAVRARVERVSASQRRRYRGAGDDAGGPRPLDRPRGHLEHRRPHGRAEPAELLPPLGEPRTVQRRCGVGLGSVRPSDAARHGDPADAPPVAPSDGDRRVHVDRDGCRGAHRAVLVRLVRPGRPHLRRIRVRRRDQSLPGRSAGSHLGVDQPLEQDQRRQHPPRPALPHLRPRERRGDLRRMRRRRVPLPGSRRHMGRPQRRPRDHGDRVPRARCRLVEMAARRHAGQREHPVRRQPGLGPCRRRRRRGLRHQFDRREPRLPLLLPHGARTFERQGEHLDLGPRPAIAIHPCTASSSTRPSRPTA